MTSARPRIGIIGIIGTGPTALYTLRAMLRRSEPLDIVLFEAGRVAGPGIPFHKHFNAPHALANIASIELPPLEETLSAWACRQPRQRLEGWGIAGEAADERAFFPRVVLGAYFADQFAVMLRRVPPQHRVTLRRRTRVTDVIARPDGTVLCWRSGGQSGEERVDRLVVATGYQAPRRKSALSSCATPDLRNTGILGSSLSAIDAVMEIARAHGRFLRRADGLRFEGEGGWHVTMLSRSGLLPEADFWFPCPAQPLDIFTDAAITPLVQGRDGDLDRVFELFARQLRALDPDYTNEIGLEEATADTFTDRHFARRMASAPFLWAERDLAEARRSHREKQTQPWRYALLRMHEAFGRAVARFTPRELARFEAGLRRCFTDNYAAVPHLSIERLLALHRAGVLSVERLGQHYRLSHEGAGWRVVSGDLDRRFDAMVDARGQQALGVHDFPFPTLRLQLCASALARGSDGAEGVVPGQGYVIDPEDAALARVHCLALPFLLKRNPFIQGLVESAGMARSCVEAMMRAQNAATYPPAADPVRDDLRAMLAQMDQGVPVYCGAGGAIMIPRPARVMEAA
jgi:uncharacterized NAD(P)/FAD-binding protein YdhS